MRVLIIIIFLLLLALWGLAQPVETSTRNIIVITLDGYRWQEVFLGADQRIIKKGKYIEDPQGIEGFQGASAAQRRETLMPFLWSVIGNEGQLYGNRKRKNKVNCSNIHLLSYPGYSEMLVGFTDPSIHSNEKIVNPNPTVLEFIDKHDDYKDKVVAFATWDAFPYILREEKSDILVNAGSERVEGAHISEAERILNEKQVTDKNPYGARYDAFTFQLAFEHLKRERPKVMLIGFDETDEHAHGGRYDEYLKSAHKTDQMISELWNWIQSQDDYRDQTTLFITTDHGRGKGKNTWRNHRLFAPGSGQIWFAVIGPDTPAFGEMKMKARYKQKQVAKTIAAFLGLQYKHHEEPVGEVVQTMIASPSVRTGSPFQTSGSERN
jgi:hypothetical protein